jgi:hypothetical protein
MCARRLRDSKEEFRSVLVPVVLCRLTVDEASETFGRRKIGQAARSRREIL